MNSSWHAQPSGAAARARAPALLQDETACDIVVGTGVEALHLVAPAIPRGKDQNRHGPAGAPPCLKHRNPVHLRQANVQDHRIVGLTLAEVMPFLAVESAVDDVAGVRQRGRELPIEIGIVLDNKKPQEIAPLTARRPVYP